MSRYWVYILECEANHLYVGIALDPIVRFQAHCQGKGARCTRMRRPRRIIGAFPVNSKGEALSAEHKIKRMTKQEKSRIAVLASNHSDWIDFCIGRESEIINTLG